MARAVSCNGRTRGFVPSQGKPPQEGQQDDRGDGHEGEVGHIDLAGRTADERIHHANPEDCPEGVGESQPDRRELPGDLAVSSGTTFLAVRGRKPLDGLSPTEHDAPPMGRR